MHNLCFVTDASLIIFDFFQIYSIFIGQIVEKIQVFFSYFTFLFVSKNQINPISNIFTYIVRLQLFPLSYDKLISIFGPYRKLNIMNSFFLLSQTKIMMFDI